MEKVKHELSPIYNEFSRILILGTMPSVKSREVGFYYGHPKNRFWKVLEKVFEEQIIDKKEFLLKHHIALWDVLSSCSIKGSSDASIKNAKPNKKEKILKETEIKAIFTTGKTAYKYYLKFFDEKIKLPVICLSSTSPANAKVSLEKLIEEYKIIKDYLKEEK